MITKRYLHNLEQTRWYEIFSQNLIKMELKQKGRKGFIIVGPSKNGKTVIMCSLTGLNMQTSYKELKDMTYIQVSNQDPQLNRLTYSQGVNSITQVPNTRQFNSQISIVDMPGHSDSHILRQLCNFYYIREMVLKMNSFHFMLVLGVRNKKLNDVDIKMMQSFKQMFPNASKYLSICINKCNQTQKQPLMESIRKQLEQNHPQISDFYSLALKTSSKIVLIPKQEARQTKIWKCPQQVRRLVINSQYISKKDCQFGEIQYDDRAAYSIFAQNTLNFYRESESRIKLLKQVLLEFLNQILKARINNKTQIIWSKIIKDHQLQKQFCINYTSQSQFERIMDLQIEQYQERPQACQYEQVEYVNRNQLCSKLIIQQSFKMLKDLFSIENVYSLKQAEINQVIFKKMLIGIKCLKTIINQNMFVSSSQNVLQIRNQRQNITLKDYLNIATLLTIRKFKQLIFLLSANKQLQKQVKYLHDETVDKAAYQPLVNLSCMIGKQIVINNKYQGNMSINIWKFQKSLIELIQNICKFVKQETKQYFKKKERLTYFIIYYSKSNKIEKILDLCQFLKIFHTNFEKSEEVIEALIFIAQILEETSLNGLAMNIYKKLGHTLSYKRVLSKEIIHLQKKQKVSKLIASGKYFSILLDEENAFQSFQRALQLTVDPDERKKISIQIKLLRDRNSLQQRVKQYEAKVNSWNSQQIAGLIQDTKSKIGLISQRRGSQQNNQQLFFLFNEDINALQQMILRGRQRIYGLQN